MYYDFATWHVAPVLAATGGRQLALLGETAKLVPVSVHRFRSVNLTAAGVSLTLAGDPGEEVEVEYAVVAENNGGGDPWASASMHRIAATMRNDGTNTVLLLA